MCCCDCVIIFIWRPKNPFDHSNQSICGDMNLTKPLANHCAQHVLLFSEFAAPSCRIRRCCKTIHFLCPLPVFCACTSFLPPRCLCLHQLEPMMTKKTVGRRFISATVHFLLPHRRLSFCTCITFFRARTQRKIKKMCTTYFKLVFRVLLPASIAFWGSS